METKPEPKHPITPKDMHTLTGKFFQVKVSFSQWNCPECGREMTYRWTTGTYKGQPKVALIHAQCVVNPGSDHGYGPKSKHVDSDYRLSGGLPEATPTEQQEETKEDMAPKKTTTPAISAPSNPMSAFEAWLEERVGARMAALEESVKEGKLTKTLEVKNETQAIKIEGLRHPILDELCERYAMGERTFLLTGPAGTGKTTIARQFAKAVKATRCTVIACSEDLRREAFVGFRTYNIGNGTAPYVASPVVEDLRVENSVTILEEIDASNPNALLTINALENGFLPTPECDERPEHARPASHVLIATANTWGTAGSTQYVGRNQLDAATLDRYRTLFVDYDPDLEAALVGDADVVALVVDIRAKVNDAQLRKVVSTRMARRIAFDRKMISNKKKSLKVVAKHVMQNSGWQANELSRVGM